MKPTPFIKASVLALVSTAALFCQASAAVEVTAEVVISREKKEASAEKEEKKLGMAPKAATAQEKGLKIAVRSSKPESGAVVRYWFVGRDMKTNKVALLDGGESPADIKANAEEIIVTKAVKVAKPKPGGAAKPGAKPGAAPAGGAGAADSVKLAGYGVQVIKENAVIAEVFSEPGVKQVIGSNGKTPGPLFHAPEPEAK
jgi:hypothetical protein